MNTNKLRNFLSDFLLTIFLMLLSTAFAFLFFSITRTNSANIAIIYILSLILTARYTNGYWYGITFALFSVIFVNFFFTYPYFSLNFTLTGYPITFLGMLTIALITSTTTSHLKIQSSLLLEREDILNKAEKETMRANLLRAISHDLRTPLTSIIGASDSYFEEENYLSQEKKEELVHKINDDSHWLLNMVENLLSITRIQDSETKVTKSLEAVEEVAAEAVHRFRKRQPDAVVKTTIPEEFIMVPMDPLLIEQVIINLLENAFIHSASNREIVLIVENTESAILFHVRDYGKGIEPSMLPTIFDGTSTRNSEMSDAHRGMGIGLSICKTIVGAHNGTISAKNHSEGAEFIFALPKEIDE